MTARASWQGYLRIAELSCGVSLYAAASTAERTHFHVLNRETGNRVQRRYVDEESGEIVDATAQVKGYATGEGDFVVIDPEEIAAAMPQSDKTLTVEHFISCGDVDTVYFDRPYYLAPRDEAARETFDLICAGMRESGVAALARTVLFRRMRTVLIRAQEDGMAATTLHFDYEVRPAAEIFRDVRKVKIDGEMLALARHIIDTKRGSFDPRAFGDRYEQALAELVAAKRDGRKLPVSKPPKLDKVVDLMAALRQSAGEAGDAGETKAGGGKARPKRAAAKKAPAAAPTTARRRKAG